MTTRAGLLNRLLDPERVFVFDGAMGTMLYAKGVFINQCYDELNLKAPDLVRDVHAAYAKAGAEVLETNTFGANRLKLSQYGLESQVREINREAARIARDVAGDDHLVAGAVGPLGVRIEPYGPTSVEEAYLTFHEQMQALKEGGVDLFLLETFGDLAEISQGVRAARAVDPTMPVIAQMTVGVDGRTAYGAGPDDLARTLEQLDVDVIGLNCSVGPQAILEAIEKMAAVTRKKLSAQPNAGMPRDVGGRSMYMASPEYMASYARHLIQAGAKIIGGCCGTTPDHVRAMVQGVRPLAPRIAGAGNREPGTEATGIGNREWRSQSPFPVPRSRFPVKGLQPSSVGRTLAFRREDRERRDGHVRRDRAAARGRREQDAVRRRGAEARRRRRRQRARRPACAEPHGRGHDQPPHRAAGRHRDRHPLLLP